MAKWKTVKIGDLFDLEKGELQSTKCTPGKHPFLTAADSWKTHNEYSHNCEALVFAAAASGSLGRTHYVNEKFVTSDLCFILTPKDALNYPIHLPFYHFVFSAMRNEIVSQTKSGTSKESISQRSIKAYELPYFNIDLQKQWIDRLLTTKASVAELDAEITDQQTLLKKLRQSILQDAIQGKLTADWRTAHPDTEPATALLKRIQAEKQTLLAAKKIRKQKPLPPINPEEIPFEIPNGWTWCRFGDYAIFERGRFSARPRNDPAYFGGKYPFIQIGSLDNEGSVVLEHKQTLNEKGLATSKMFKEGTIAIAIVGGTIGNLGVLGFDMCFPDSMIGISPNPIVAQEYVMILLKYMQPDIRKMAYQMAGQPNIKIPMFTDLLIPLPPLAEQEAIVAQVTTLFEMVDGLEQQTTRSRSDAAALMASVLAAAFASS